MGLPILKPDRAERWLEFAPWLRLHIRTIYYVIPHTKTAAHGRSINLTLTGVDKDARGDPERSRASVVGVQCQEHHLANSSCMRDLGQPLTDPLLLARIQYWEFASRPGERFLTLNFVCPSGMCYNHAETIPTLLTAGVTVNASAEPSNAQDKSSQGVEND